MIDSRPFVRIAVSCLLESSQPRETAAGFVVKPYAGVAEFLDRCVDPLRDVDIVLLNSGAASVHDAPVQADVARLRETLPDIPLALMCDQGEACHGRSALRLGVDGYIPTTLSPAVVAHALCLVHAGGTFAPANVLLQADESDRKNMPIPVHERAAFTARERDVLGLVWQGKPNKVIAFELNVSESTVKVYVRQIMKKLGATNRTHAIFLLSQTAFA